MAKKVKIEKETRRLMEFIGDAVKKRNGVFRFKSKKKGKKIKKVPRCIHWIYRKGKAVPTVYRDPDHQDCWRCSICGEIFPIEPLKATRKNRKGKLVNPYSDKSREMIGYVNQIQFWSVQLGGDADDMKMFFQLRRQLQRFSKVSGNILRNMEKRKSMEDGSNAKDVMSAFDAYTSYSYRP